MYQVGGKAYMDTMVWFLEILGLFCLATLLQGDRNCQNLGRLQGVSILLATRTAMVPHESYFGKCMGVCPAELSLQAPRGLEQ